MIFSLSITPTASVALKPLTEAQRCLVTHPHSHSGLPVKGGDGGGPLEGTEHRPATPPPSRSCRALHSCSRSLSFFPSVNACCKSSVVCSGESSRERSCNWEPDLGSFAFGSLSPPSTQFFHSQSGPSLLPFRERLQQQAVWTLTWPAAHPQPSRNQVGGLRKLSTLRSQGGSGWPL